MATAEDDVQLPDLQVIQRYSLAVRGATAPRADVVAALEADLAWLTGTARRRAAAPAVTAAPAPVTRTAPVTKAASTKKAAPRKAAPTKKAAAKRGGRRA